MRIMLLNHDLDNYTKQTVTMFD